VIVIRDTDYVGRVICDVFHEQLLTVEGLVEASNPREEIADRMRGRILRGLQAGTVRAGDRLPPSRELAAEFDVDHRMVLDAYRALDAEGIVEMRPRGGVYVGSTGSDAVVPLPSASWLADVFLQAINREIPIVELHDWMRRAVETLRVRAVVIQRTQDQIAGLCRELRDYYGLEATGFSSDLLEGGEDLPVEFRFADLLITTAAFDSVVRPLAHRLPKKLIVVDVRPDLIGGEWRLLLKQPVYLVAADAGFLEVVQQFFAGTPGAENIRPLVVGRDSLESIPPDASVYLTTGAREQLGDRTIPGRILPTGRFLSNASALELVRYLVEANLRALTALGTKVSS
jgi:GntR family transcriptional regulator